MRPVRCLAVMLLGVLAGCAGGITVRNPQSLPAHLPVQTVPVGIAGDYKPDLALLPDGELLLVMFQPQHNANGTYQENIILYRSADGGQTWGTRQVLPLLGREPYFSITRGGVLFLTAQFLPADYRNTLGYSYAFVYRSEDNGRSWQGLPVTLADVPGGARSKGTITSRTILELSDGSLLLGVSSGATSYVWRSHDSGLSWQRVAARTPDVARDGVHEFFDEMVLYQPVDGGLLGIGRIGACELLPPFPGTRCPTSGGDITDRMALFRSADGGATWQLDGPLGDYYGQMYPALLRLPHDAMLFTFTDRDLQVPLGVEAARAAATPHGFTVNFVADRILIDTHTPATEPNGGGFGNTVQLRDGTLVTAYSYRDGAGLTHAQVARWRLTGRAADAARRNQSAPGVS